MPEKMKKKSSINHIAYQLQKIVSKHCRNTYILEEKVLFKKCYLDKQTNVTIAFVKICIFVTIAHIIVPLKTDIHSNLVRLAKHDHGGDRAGWVIESVFLCSPDKGFWACLGDPPPDMPRRPENLGFAVQFNDETPWHFAQLRYLRVE